MQYKPTFSTSRSLILVWKRPGGGRLAVERRLHDPNLSRDWSVVVTHPPDTPGHRVLDSLVEFLTKVLCELLLLLPHGLPLPVSAHADANPGRTTTVSTLQLQRMVLGVIFAVRDTDHEIASAHFRRTLYQRAGHLGPLVHFSFALTVNSSPLRVWNLCAFAACGHRTLVLSRSSCSLGS